LALKSRLITHGEPEVTFHRYPDVMPRMQREAADKIAKVVRFDGLAA